MIEGIGNEIARTFGCLLMLALAAVVILGVVLFCLGRCSAQKNLHLQSPIVVQEKPAVKEGRDGP